jgi:hypothetical protein
MGVQVDEAGRDRHSRRVDFLRAAPVHCADRDDNAVLYRDIANERLRPGAIDDQAAADHRVELLCHFALLLRLASAAQTSALLSFVPNIRVIVLPMIAGHGLVPVARPLAMAWTSMVARSLS